ncbi:cache domain-containing protein [Shimia biformata]|uniref:cache domain-containing protein n=1 Tax=Shimia biformata TaxID=1294299 RepID=UPI00194DAF93|nr:adenylate/guanylate cyclase domain-containing protein [Shimia biformata]
MRARIRLHVGLATAYSIATLLLIAGIVGYLFYSASQLAVATATKSMEDVAADVERSVTTLFAPVGRSVRTTAFLVQDGHIDFTADEGRLHLFRLLRAMPEVTSIYVAFAHHGQFSQVARNPLAEGDNPERLGTYLVRKIDIAPAAFRERQFSIWHYFSETEIKGKPFDPRQRPWYARAVERTGLALSDPYVFASTGRTGLTVSQRVRNDNDEVIAVVGADITLDGLSHYLAEKTVGANGRVFIIDHSGEVIVGAETEAGDDDGDLAAGVDGAIRHYLETRDESFRVGGDRTFLASFRPFPREFGQAWSIGVLADRAELIGGIRQSTIKTVGFSLLYALIAIAGMAVLSQRITAPLRRVISETRRIRQFELDGEFSLRSPIAEIDNLAQSVANMKSGLRSFKAFVPVDLVQSILSSGKSMEIGGEMRAATLMFTDIEGFSSKSEALPADVVFKDLSTYFGAMSQCVTETGGTVDKFIGDAVMAFWNAPQRDPDHTLHACRAALACATWENGQTGDAQGNPSLFPTYTRFGIHVGQVFVGNVGSDSRMQYTALGTDVNLASRLEGLNKKYGTRILVTDPVAERVQEQFHLRLVDVTVPAGTSTQLRIHELIAEKGSDDPALMARLADWQQVMTLYLARDWPAARDAVTSFVANWPDDPVAVRYQERIETFVANPPPEDWDGSFVQTDK